MSDRIVITGVGLTSPLGDDLKTYRENLLAGKSGIEVEEIRYMGQVPLAKCHFEETKYQKKKMRKRGTRVGAISIYCANEAIKDSGIDFDNLDKDRVGVYLGITEHGNVETENEVYELHQNNLDTSMWSHHHNPRTVSNSPAGEVSLNLKITGPAYTIGAACAAGNIGLIHGVQMLRAGEVDTALVGGVSESIHTFGIFAAFAAQGALGFHEDPKKSTKPLDKDRNGIAIAEGGAIYMLERYEDAIKRGAKIYGEVVGYHINSDASDFVLPNPGRQKECIEKALKKANLEPNQIDIVNLHATGTVAGDINEIEAVGSIFGRCENTKINCTKGFIGHAMGAAGALELAGNLPSFNDEKVHACLNVDEIDPNCKLDNLVLNEPIEKKEINYILSNSFGMLGINSVVIIKKIDN